MRIMRRLLLIVTAGGLIAAAGACGTRPEAAPSAPTQLPVRPVNTSAAPTLGVPPVSDAAREAGFIDVRSVVPDAVVDLRYATTNNFTHVALYPADARCLVAQPMAPLLAAAAVALRSQGHVMVFWDCYRPHDVQVRMFNVVPNPAWVARPGQYAHSHESGLSVDVTFTNVVQQCPPERQVNGGLCLADMGTEFDDFSPRATAFATEGVNAGAQANRAALRDAMKHGGLAPYAGEWWHFDGPGAGTDRPILNVPVD